MSERFRPTDIDGFFGDNVYERAVPPNHFLRQMKGMVDWEGLCGESPGRETASTSLVGGSTTCRCSAANGSLCHCGSCRSSKTISPPPPKGCQSV
jgi:hypothetical protein